MSNVNLEPHVRMEFAPRDSVLDLTLLQIMGMLVPLGTHLMTLKESLVAKMNK